MNASDLEVPIHRMTYWNISWNFLSSNVAPRSLYANFRKKCARNVYRILRGETAWKAVTLRTGKEMR